MKKAVALVLLVVLVSLSGMAYAGENEDMSVAMLNIMIVKLGQTEDASVLFDIDDSYAYVDDEGDVIVCMESNFPYSIYKREAATIRPQLCVFWSAFNDIHVLFSKRDFYLSIVYSGTPVYFVAEDMLIDGDYNTYPHSRIL